MTKEQAYILASAHLTTRELPEDWGIWSKETLYEFLDKYRWGPFADMSTECVWEHIGFLADDFLKVAKESADAALEKLKKDE